MHLKRRWKSMRDSYVRELLRQQRDKAYGNDRGYRRQYRFFPLLQFLNERTYNDTDVSTNNPLLNEEHNSVLNIEENSTQDPDEDNIDDELQVPIDFVKEENLTMESSDIIENKVEADEYRDYEIIHIPTATSVPHNNELIEKITTEMVEDSDPERMFLLSLLPDLKKVPDGRKLDVKIEMMNVIKRARTDHQFSSH